MCPAPVATGRHTGGPWVRPAHAPPLPHPRKPAAPQSCSGAWAHPAADTLGHGRHCWLLQKKRGPTNQRRTGSAGGDHVAFVHGRRASKAAQQRKRKTWGDSLPAHAMKDDHQLPRGAVQRRHRRAGHVPVLFHPSPLGRGPLGVQHNVHQRGRGCSRLQGLDDGVRGPRLHIRTIDGHHPAANCRGKHRHARSARSWSEGRRTAPPLLRGVLSTPTPTNQMGGRSRQLNQRLGQ